MKVTWLILTLIPAAFFFHFYEYGQHVQREEAPFLLVGSILYVVVTGFLSRHIKIRSVILVNTISLIISLVLAIYFIPDDGWFKPVGRGGAVVFVAVVSLVGQLIIRIISKEVLLKKE
ncbi:hypothetical protein QOZ98_001174 [Planomicrobium stackebrandtii]|uniref:Uncharacterized protein n=1 Tax=Planomicrobium stackebrandtii TaxID=253160 RepID=A0ABU0GTE7_9BACL|nr:hypothetical protein [Planomicrobium stackebrandtii]MDQ0428348.1 hypothetical protein [Planomicrobium stackebrandtii]